MPQDGPRSRFLYVEVPVPTKRARAARAIARRTPSATNTGGHELPETGQTCQKGSSTLSPGPSVKGKEREAEQDPLVISEVRNGSLPGSAQAAPESVLSTVLPAEVSTDIQAAEPSTSTLPSTNLEEAATLAQSLLKPASSSSSTSPTAKPDTEISSPAKQKTRSRRRRKKKRIIVDSEGSNSERPSFAPRPAADSGTRLQEGAVVSTNASAPTGENSIPAQGSAATVTGQVPEPEYTRLGVDEEISKILGRSLHGQRYAYTVKLSGGQRAVVSRLSVHSCFAAMHITEAFTMQVPESALHEYQDLLDDWLTLSEGGWREDGKVYSDSESEEELSNAMRGATDSDDAYSADQREASPDRDEMSEEDDVSSATSSEIPLRIEASRRSEREGAKKKVDYSKQAEYNEEDEDMSEGALTESDSDRSETDDSRSPRRARSTEKDGGRSVRKGGRRSQASKTAARVLDNDDADASEEEFIEGDIVEENLRPEQFHRQVRLIIDNIRVQMIDFWYRRAARIVKLLLQVGFCLSSSRRQKGNARAEVKTESGT